MNLQEMLRRTAVPDETMPDRGTKPPWKRTRSLDELEPPEIEAQASIEPPDSPPPYSAAMMGNALAKSLEPRNPLDEIATLVRALTYGEMMELSAAIWKIRPEGEMNGEALPGMLHRWSKSAHE